MAKSLTNPFRDRPVPLGSLITAAGQRLSGRLDRALHAAGFDDLRAAHAPIFMAIDPDGTRLTDIAERSRITKQAAGELTRYLVDHGYLQVSPDSRDRRAKVFTMTPRGWAAIVMGQQVIAEFDDWLDRTIGAGEVQQLRQVLTRLAAVDEADSLPTPATPIAGQARAARRQPRTQSRGQVRP